MPLIPTVAGRTLDVSAGGEAGLDWANIGTPGSTVGLSATTVATTTALTNAPSDSSGVTTLLTRLSALRAGYLDNLSVGAAALEASLQTLITTVGAAGAGLTATATAVWAVATRVLTAATNITSTGGTTVPQTGDSYARIGAAGVSLTAIPWNAAWDAEVQSEVQDALDATLADSIPADGTRPSAAQALYMLTQFMLERSVSGTTVTVKKADGSTTLLVLTLDDATSPTSVTRSA